MRARADWQNWHGNIARVPEECRQAVKLLAERVERKHVMSFKNNLIEIAFAVAMAFREYSDSTPAIEKFTLHLGYYWQRFNAKRQNRIPLTLAESLNISTTEQKAIKALTGALRPERIEGLMPVEA